MAIFEFKLFEDFWRMCTISLAVVACSKSLHFASKFNMISIVMLVVSLNVFEIDLSAAFRNAVTGKYFFRFIFMVFIMNTFPMTEFVVDICLNIDPAKVFRCITFRGMLFCGRNGLLFYGLVKWYQKKRQCVANIFRKRIS